MKKDEIEELYELDQIDLRIVAVLQEDASIENQELARLVHLSPAPCLRRVRRLKEDGVIKQTVALIDPARLGMRSMRSLRWRINAPLQVNNLKPCCAAGRRSWNAFD